METVVVRGSRWKAATLFTGCLVTLAFCMAMWTDPRDIRQAWIVLPLLTGTMLLGTIVSAAHLLKRPTLTLSADGLVQRTVFGEMKRSWYEMETPDIVVSVVWNLRPGAPPSRSWLAGLNRLSGYDESLFGMWTLSPKALLALVLRYHVTAIGRP